jgi:hypothetical protein
MWRSVSIHQNEKRCIMVHRLFTEDIFQSLTPSKLNMFDTDAFLFITWPFIKTLGPLKSAQYINSLIALFEHTPNVCQTPCTQVSIDWNFSFKFIPGIILKPGTKVHKAKMSDSLKTMMALICSWWKYMMHVSYVYLFTKSVKMCF